MRTYLLAAALAVLPMSAFAADHDMSSMTHKAPAEMTKGMDKMTEMKSASMMSDPKMKEMCEKMHADMAMPATPAGVTDHYGAANMKMHKDMAVTPTGDADVDFVRGMIPHHQGAVDMAKVLLEKGKDPELHKMAEGIIKAQESEIAFMNDWLKKHGQNK